MSKPTPFGTVSFPCLFKKRKNSKSGKERYEVNLIFDAEAQKTDQYKAMESAVEECFKEKFGRVPKNAKHPLKKCEDVPTYCQEDADGNAGEGPVEDRFKGCVVACFSSNDRVGIVDKTKTFIEDESTIYAGCIGRALWHVYAYEVDGSKGVNFGMDGFQFIRDGDPIAGRRKVDVKEAFDDLDFDDDPDDDI